MATDKEVKSIKTEIKEMKKAIDKIETNARHLNTRNFRHMSLLKEIISSIKRITSLKIVAVALLSADLQQQPRRGRRYQARCRRRGICSSLNSRSRAPEQSPCGQRGPASPATAVPHGGSRL